MKYVTNNKLRGDNLTKILVDMPTKYDKKLGHLRAEKYISKSVLVVKIVEDFFDKNRELEELKE